MFGSVVNRLGSSVRRALSQYAVGTNEPELALNFVDNEYRTNNSGSTFASAITHSRSGNAVMTDGYGPELLSDTGFDNSSEWTLGTGWSIYSSQLACDGSQSVVTTASQTVDIPRAGTYEATIYVKNVVSGTTGISYVSGTATLEATSSYPSTTSKGQITRYFTFSSSGTFTVNVNNTTNFVGSFDNFNFREMPVLKWAPHNLVDDSDDLTGLGSITGVTRTETVLTETTDTGSHTINIAYTPTIGEKYTVACEVKLESGTRFVSFRGFGEGGANKYPIFNLVNGTIEDSGDSYTDVSITDVGGGYYLLKGSVIASLAFSWAIHMQNSTTSGSGGYEYTGDGTSAIAIRKIRQYRSDLGGMVDNPDKTGNDVDYVPTDNAIAYLPRIGHHVYNGNAWVNEGVLAESEARTNLINYSDFSTNWATTNATKTDDDATGPDGEISAIKLEGDSTVAAHNIKRGNVSVNVSSNYTFSVFAKKGTHDAIGLRLDKSDSGAAWANFDLTNGYSKTGGGGTAADIATIEDIGNGWFRCSVTASTNSSDVNINPHIHLMDDYASPASAWNANGKDVYLYGAQLEEGYTPSSFIPTLAGSSVTRAAETFTIPSANLPWPEYTPFGSELITNGSFDTDSDWFKIQDVTIADGKATIVRTSSQFSEIVQTGVSYTSGKRYRVVVNMIQYNAGSVSIKDDSGSLGGLNHLTTNLGSGQVPFTHRVEVEWVANASSADLEISPNNNMTLEVLDVSVFEVVQGVSIAMDGRITYADEGVTNTANMLYWQDDSNNFIRHRVRTDSTNVGELQVQQEANNVNDGKAFDYLEPNILVPYSYAARHGSTFVNLATDGVAQTANVTPTELADLSSIDLDLANDYMGTIGTFRIWDRDITDDGIVEASNPSLEPSLSLTFEGTGANSFVVNDWSE